MSNSTLIYICDDDIEFCHMLEEKICDLFCDFSPQHECRIQLFDSGAALLTEWEKKRADVVFLDISMPEVDGFQVSEKIRAQEDDTVIIYVTNYDDTVYQIWDFKPFWFVRKSKMDDVDYLFPRLIQELKRREENQQSHKRLMGDREALEIDVNAVMYIESCNHDIKIHNRDGKAFQIRCRISDAASQLQDWYFGRIQQGVVVNYRFISKINSREVILLNGEKVNVSRNRLSNVRTEYQEFLRRG